MPSHQLPCSVVHRLGRTDQGHAHPYPVDQRHGGHAGDTQGYRVLDLFFPIYEQRSKGVGDWAWNQVSGESPAISYLERLARGTGKAAEGDVEGGIYTGLKSAPVIGPLTNLNKVIASNFKGWNFKGE